MHRNPSRPMSPHLTIWKWGPHMLVSILHRITGAGLALVGGAVLIWWLAAAAGSAESYTTFMGWARGRIGLVFAIGLTWAFFQHALSGVRHLVMDIGAGFELKTNKGWSLATTLGALVLTAGFWVYLLFGRGA